MKAVKVVNDPQEFQLLADGTRRKIIFLLRATEMTVSQISSNLGLTPQAIYHHIKKLQNAGFVTVEREKRVGHLIESYYRATAEAFLCSVGVTTSGREFFEKQTKTTLDALVKHVQALGALSVETAVLLSKQGRSEVDLQPDYLCFRIPDVFVVGYGLDYDDEFRYLPHVAAMDDEDLRGRDDKPST